MFPSYLEVGKTVRWRPKNVVPSYLILTNTVAAI